MNDGISFKNLIECARMLRSDSGENPEYDRALCELVGDAMGVTQEGYPGIAEKLGISPTVWDV